MTTFRYIGLALLVLLPLIFFVWRLASRRHTLPCPAWLRWLVELDNPFTQTNRARVIIDHLDLQPGMKVLDVGCGPGRLTIPLAQKVGPQGQVVAIDIQPGMLRRAQEKAEAAHLIGLAGLYVNPLKIRQMSETVTSRSATMLISYIRSYHDIKTRFKAQTIKGVKIWSRITTQRSLTHLNDFVRVA